MIPALYCDDWRIVSTEIKQSCAWRCTCCGLQCRRPGEPYRGWQYELALAHISQDYHAPVVQCQPLCAACHLAHDAPLSGVARRRAERWRRRAAGQMEMFAARG